MLKDWIEEIDKKIGISCAYLFGSYAKGRPTRWSDIDVALVSPAFKGVRFYDNKRLIPYLRDMPGLLEVHPFTKKDFNADNLFVREIIKCGIKIK